MYDNKEQNADWRDIDDRLHYDEDAGTYHVEFDWSEEDVSTTIVLAIAEITGGNPVSVAPLIERINPDSLDTLFVSEGARTPRDEGSVSFLFADHVVTVFGRGEVVLDPPDAVTER